MWGREKKRRTWGCSMGNSTKRLRCWTERCWLADIARAERSSEVGASRVLYNGLYAGCWCDGVCRVLAWNTFISRIIPPGFDVRGPCDRRVVCAGGPYDCLTLQTSP